MNTEAVWTLPVSEVFGPTIQGEGPHAGKAVQFVRLGLCNLSCRNCDTPYTWDSTRFDLRKENPPTSIVDVLDQIESDVITVLSGGEPLLHQGRDAFTALLDGLAVRGPVHVETNGTIEPSHHTRRRVTHFSVSPKLGAMPQTKRTHNPEPWDGWGGVLSACAKYVVRDRDDVSRAYHAAINLGFPPHRIWVMPEGTTTEQLQARWPEIARAAADLRINASHRLHVLAWGDRKGT